MDDFCGRCGALMFRRPDGSWEHYPAPALNPNYWGWDEDPHEPVKVYATAIDPPIGPYTHMVLW